MPPPACCGMALRMRDTRVRAIRSRASFEVQRRQRQRLVVDDLDRRAAAAEHDHGAEGRVVGDAGDQLARLAAARSSAARSSPSMRACGVAALHALAEYRCAAASAASALVRFSRTPPTSDLCTMSGDRILTATAAWPRQEWRRAASRASAGVAATHDRHGRDAVGRQQRRYLDRIEPAAALSTARADDRAAPSATSGLKSVGRLGGVSINASRASLIAHHVHEAADRIGLGRKVRNRRLARKPAPRVHPRRARPQAPVFGVCLGRDRRVDRATTASRDLARPRRARSARS